MPGYKVTYPMIVEVRVSAPDANNAEERASLVLATIKYEKVFPRARWEISLTDMRPEIEEEPAEDTAVAPI